MAKRPLTSVVNDLNGVISFFKGRGILPTAPSPGQLAGIRRLHRSTYGLILWRFRLRNIPEHGQAFIEEIASDALQILPQALMGYGKTTKLLTRGVIENTLRHIYFVDHPVEFVRMNNEKKYFLAIAEFFEYLGHHPAFLETEPKFDAIGKLNSLYSDLSAGVHGRRVQDLEMRIALDKIAFSQEAFERNVELVERCAEACNFLLATFHKLQMRLFEREDRRILLATMCTKARQVWTGLGE